MSDNELSMAIGVGAVTGIEDKCPACKGEASVTVKNGITGFYPCSNCNGTGGVMRQIVAEDLSIDEQRRMIMAWTDFCETKTKDEPQSLEDWKGLKK